MRMCLMNDKLPTTAIAVLVEREREIKLKVKQGSFVWMEPNIKNKNHMSGRTRQNESSWNSIVAACMTCMCFSDCASVLQSLWKPEFAAEMVDCDESFASTSQAALWSQVAKGKPFQNFSPLYTMFLYPCIFLVYFCTDLYCMLHISEFKVLATPRIFWNLLGNDMAGGALLDLLHVKSNSRLFGTRM